MDIQTVNDMNYEAFLDNFGNIIEKCPLVAAAVWSKLPFSSLHEMEECVYEFIDSLPPSGKEGILRCHPDLAGRELASGSLTMESQKEQRQAGLTSLSTEEREQLGLLNFQYKTKFAFPFVICAKMSDKDKILQEISRRLRNDPSQELLKGIEEVKKICHLRVQDILSKGLPTKL
ncbi:putative 2-oxo-4-hydroxy-4-carboxy-5-ureidoimidazoline decarboxylase [Hyperolius riggenbachi]|uniref:putative 2-oxo-4-hydroxy-4-carboxy-5-ureidoimidazoline decarboxylase n=1 Tax=Hyperolius riggenbachi TaxID=752182 RepID=UPI0035A36039